MSGREFCLRCDSILPLEITGTAVICRLCQLAHSYTDLLNKEIHSTVIFNTTDVTEEVCMNHAKCLARKADQLILSQYLIIFVYLDEYRTYYRFVLAQ